MSTNQFHSIAILGFLSSSAFSLTVPSLPAVPNGAFSPSVIAERASAGLSSTEAYLDSLTKIGDTWTASSFESSLKEVLDDKHVHFDWPADKLIGKVFSQDSTSTTIDLPFVKAAPVMESSTNEYQDVIMGGSKPDITDLVPPNDFALDVLASVTGSTDAESSLNSLSTPLTDIVTDKSDGFMSQIAAFAQEQQAQITNKMSDISPLPAVEETISKMQEQQAEIGDKVVDKVADAIYRMQEQQAEIGDKVADTIYRMQEQQAEFGDKIADMTASAFKIPDVGQIFSKGIVEKGSTAIRDVGATIETETSSLIETSGANAKALTEKPVSELAGDIEQLTTGTINSLHTTGNYLFKNLNVVLETNPSLTKVVEVAQASVQKVLNGAVEALLSAVNSVGDITLRQMIQALVQLVIIVTKVLFQIISMVVAATSGHGLNEWIDYAGAAIQEEALQLGMMANSLAADLSHKSVTQLLSMTDSFLHDSTLLMADSIGYLGQFS